MTTSIEAVATRRDVARHSPKASQSLVIPPMLLIIALLVAMLTACTKSQPTGPATQKVGVLLVSHGSRSVSWRKALTDLDARVRGPILSDGKVAGVKSAFMEYTEPSIATRLKEFDQEGFSDVIVVPVFLTVSPHPFDDIPTIMGQKTDPQSLETLKVEAIERYTPRARVRITPLLDFTDILQANILRRATSLSKTPADEGLVLIAYGDNTYEKEWAALLDTIGAHVAKETQIATHAYGWCGHIVHYDPAKTTAAIEQVLATKARAIVIPVLVAYDEEFQGRIIGDGIAKIVNNKERVVYRPDSILPDKDLDQWIVDVTRKYVAEIDGASEGKASP